MKYVSINFTIFKRKKIKPDNLILCFIMQLHEVGH